MLRKKLLIQLLFILLLIVGCEDVGVMKHEHDEYEDKMIIIQNEVLEKM